MAEHNKQLERAKKDVRKETRDNLIRSLYHNTGLSYAKIGEIPAIDLTKQAVGAIVREEN
jgi:hypothetical protein